jgi:nucleoside-diphosphate-sugar epimerase
MLLTGGTGLVGSAFLAERLKDSETARVVILTRKPRSHPDPRVTFWGADLTTPSFGLAPDQYRWLRRNVTTIVHCAADIRFVAPPEESRLVNAGATAHLLALARRCSGLQQFAHVSTVYVAGLQEGTFEEQELPEHDAYASIYQRTKHEAERLVCQAMSSLPCAIYRLSSVAGGRCDHVHQLIRLAARNIFPCIPVSAHATVDLIRVDWAAKALSHLIHACFQPGEVAHVCAGPSHAVKATDVLGAVLARTRTRTLPVHVSWKEFASVLEGLCKSSGAMRALAPWLRACAPHLSIRQQFNNQRLSRSEFGSACPPPAFDLDALVARSLA